MTSVISDIQLARSVTSIGTNSSGVSVGWMNVEPAPSVVNSDKNNTIAEGKDSPRWRRKFKGRHIQMMGLGIVHLYIDLTREGAGIGTGILYQSGRVLYYAGPIPALLGYVLMGTVIYSVLVRFHVSCI
jgi:amino acid permease